jgi:hypothetical protein
MYCKNKITFLICIVTKESHKKFQVLNEGYEYGIISSEDLL